MTTARSKPRGAGGRPPAHRAGEVDLRILETASELFLAHGFEATSCEQVAARAGCGKASIYARYADKGELFAATIKHKLAGPPTSGASTDGVIDVCTEVLESLLSADAVRLKRLLIAEATRFPELVGQADRVLRERAIASIAAVLGKPEAAAKLLDFVVAPLELRALFGEKLTVLRSEVRRRVEDGMATLRRPSRS